MERSSLRAVVGAVLAVVLEIGLLCGFQTPAQAECLNLPQFLADVGANAQKMQFRTETPLTYGFSTDKNPRLSQVADIMAKDREQKRSGGAGKSEFKAGSGAEVLDAVFPQSLSQKGCESVSFGMQAWQVVQSTERSITISRFDKKAYEKTVCRFEVWGTAEQGQLLKTCTQDLNPEHLDFPLKKSKIVMKGSFVFSTGALLSWGDIRSRGGKYSRISRRIGRTRSGLQGNPSSGFWKNAILPAKSQAGLSVSPRAGRFFNPQFRDKI